MKGIFPCSAVASAASGIKNSHGITRKYTECIHYIRAIPRSSVAINVTRFPPDPGYSTHPEIRVPP